MLRRPLAPIASNIVRRRELSNSERVAVCSASKLKHTNAEISKQFKIPYSTVKRTVESYHDTGNPSPEKRPGRPKKLSDRSIRLIERLIRKDPTINYKQLIEEVQLDVSCNTIKRMLGESGISKWIAQKKPRLGPEAARKRYEWCLARRDWVQEWYSIIWTDECLVERGAGKQRCWVFRKPHEKWKKVMIQPYSKGRDLTIMVWGGFYTGGRTDLIDMPGDPLSARGGSSAASYISVLEEGIPQIYEPGLTFMHDNASIHRARIARQWLQDHGIPVMEWPPYSPDLNPIEHAWHMLKEWLYKHHPELLDDTSVDWRAERRLFDALKAGWDAISEEIFVSLVESMPRRIEAVIAAGGWYTKY